MAKTEMEKKIFNVLFKIKFMPSLAPVFSRPFCCPWPVCSAEPEQSRNLGFRFARRPILALCGGMGGRNRGGQSHLYRYDERPLPRPIRFPRAIILLLLVLALTEVKAADQAYEGYILYAKGYTHYICNLQGEVAHTWTSEYQVATCGRLLPDGSILTPVIDNEYQGPSLSTGRFQVINWEGEVLWDYSYHGADFCPHHNIDYYYPENAPTSFPNVFAAVYKNEGTTVSDDVIEIQPTSPTSGEIVWRWNAWDHRTEGDGIGEPALLSILLGARMDWLHLNSISYNPELNQLLLGIKNFGEFMIIDHSTTTQEAASGAGGIYGKGGRILYRWGNSANYLTGGNKYMRGFHGAVWIPPVMLGTDEPLPGAGNVILVQNENRRLDEVELPGAGDGVYPREENQSFGPAQPLWSIAETRLSSNEGSIQKLPNGNYLICQGLQGSLIFEITPEGETVFELTQVDDLSGSNQADADSSYGGSSRVFKYARTYSGVARLEGASVRHKQLKNYLFSVAGSGRRYKVPGTDIKLVKIYNVLGDLVNTVKPENSVIEWNAKDYRGKLVNQGIYLIRLIGRESYTPIKVMVHW